ncbi:peptidase MA superfamily protein [Prosthecobacter fusiformis]|uniref:Peptidase MA superfamily protein n=1 Tax=Prosthecobacter fusiformis TaxID=48464 RepID=A0A4R7S6I9_9BACT|nr:peptidase MA family metallohydrolase [Prosthecobacter fusiformis]TDU73178.1 peptidase MA superfamily protein [Prosthecobacter fusiformis]
MRCRTLLQIVICLMLSLSGKAQELDLDRLYEDSNLAPVGRLLAKGEYELCGRICEAAIQRGMKAPEWRLMRVRALMLQGQEETARDEVELAVKTYPGNLELLMLQHENARRLGRQDIADQALSAVNEAAKSKPANDRTAQEWVSLGQAALALGADAKKVIAQYFLPAQKKDPKLEAAYLAEGYLALQKDDAARAADVFRAGLKAHGETAALRTGLARAFANGDREKQLENIVRALELNPAQAEAHLMKAEVMIGSEKFLEAEAAIQKVIEVQENSPEAWALRAAVAQLSAASPEKISAARKKGLERWPQNPEVDHILGRVISRSYRFAEGAAHQRQALKFAPGYLPAKVQLCHDLLRLGDEEEAWKLAAEIRDQDGYNIQAHNIGLLEKEMNGYVTKSYDDFILKMPKRDWPIYGESALALLREAKAVLCPKYGLELKRPVMVEFFGAQQDFAIRTFGSLGGQGLLGVCFGTVITMNSPGSLAHGRNNWESTLWHEFCHVVTLTITQNKMPRWLSEGISVHEESLRNPAWGMKMDATFREMILEDEATTPVSQLSSAFLNAEDEDHLLFAYYQSSQVVAYLLDRFGPEAIQNILKDLAAGKRINDAIADNTESMDHLEKDFNKKLKDMARKQYGALADWKKPEPDEVKVLDLESLTSFKKQNPKNLWAIRRYAEAMVQQEKWEEVLKTADQLIQVLPEDTSAGGGYQLKADALQKLKREEEELQNLRYMAEHETGAMPIFLRLIEADLAQQDWASLQANARRAIALNPFLRSPQYALAVSAEATNQPEEAIRAYRCVLQLDPATASQTHYRLAHLLQKTDAAQAKRHLLDSLALAPRFREGHEMLRNWD